MGISVEKIQKFRDEKYANIGWDYCSSGVWNKEGTNVPAEWLPVNNETLDDISYWHSAKEYYSSYSYLSDDETKQVDGMEEAFQQWKTNIVNDIKKQLPDWTIE